MPIPRSHLVDDAVSGLYHCISRCVRRAFLCGGKHDHRREWILDRMRELVRIFAIEVSAYAIMENHLHLLAWTDPEKASKWTRAEVAERWLRLYPPAAEVPLEDAVEVLAHDVARIAILRRRLASLSWFMKSLKEPIARRANREDECTGAFWEGRFKSYRVVDEAGALTCCVYIDLNSIRAGSARTPEDSRYTSIRERITGRTADGSWLAPLDDQENQRTLFAMTTDEYIDLVDCLGRLRRGTAHHIDKKLAPILDRVALDLKRWPGLVLARARKLWGTTIGKPDGMATEARRRKCSRVVNPFGRL